MIIPENSFFAVSRREKFSPAGFQSLHINFSTGEKLLDAKPAAIVTNAFEKPGKTMKIISKTGEITYVFAIILTCLGVALMTKADFGLSMVVAPAYILSQKVGALSFGMAEYIIQALLLVALFCAVRKFEWRYLLTFAAAVIYGAVLDLIISLTDAYTVPESIPVRCVLFAAGLLICDAGVALYFKSYLPPCCYDMFVRELSDKLSLYQPRVKTVYDVSSFFCAVAMSLIFFGRLRGIGIGTVVCVLVNGPLIGAYGKLFSRFTDFSPAVPGLFRIISTRACSH